METRAAFQEAFEHWEGVSGLQFKEVRTLQLPIVRPVVTMVV